MSEEKDREIKRLKSELLDRIDTMENVSLKLEKACTVLAYWLVNYSYCEKPDPRLTFHDCVPSKNEHEEIHRQQSFAWFRNYHRIILFIHIVEDYVRDSQKLLEETINLGCNVIQPEQQEQALQDAHEGGMN